MASRRQKNIVLPNVKSRDVDEYHDGYGMAYKMKLGSTVPGKGRVVTVAIRSLELLDPAHVKGFKGPEVSVITYRPVD